MENFFQRMIGRQEEVVASLVLCMGCGLKSPVAEMGNIVIVPPGATPPQVIALCGKNCYPKAEQAVTNSIFRSRTPDLKELLP